MLGGGDGCVRSFTQSFIDIWQGQSAMDGITPNALWQFTPPPDDLIRQEIAPNPAAAATHLANL